MTDSSRTDVVDDAEDLDSSSTISTRMKFVATDMTMKIGPVENGIRSPLRPTVGAKCRGGFNDISINDGKKCGTRQRWHSRGIG